MNERYDESAMGIGEHATESFYYVSLLVSFNDVVNYEFNNISLNINTVKKMMLENVGTLCPTCCTPFDKGKHRKLIDTCGHELCYMCINSDHCPLCVYHAQAQSQHRLSQDNGIPRPRLKTNGHFTAYMQTRERVSPERPLPGASLPPKVKPPVPERTVSGYSPRISRASRNHRQMKWPNPLISDSQAALS
ncbi:hypothetical protein AVEN_245019-1, partial [Araneus ventricosus]